MNAIVRNKVALRLLSLVTGNDFLCSRVSIGRKRKKRGNWIVLIEGSGVSGWRLRKILITRCGCLCGGRCSKQRRQQRRRRRKMSFWKRKNLNTTNHFGAVFFAVYYKVLYTCYIFWSAVRLKKITFIMYMRTKFKETWKSLKRTWKRLCYSVPQEKKDIVPKEMYNRYL